MSVPPATRFALAALAAAGLVGCGSSRNTPPASTVVPWIDRPLPLHHVPSPRTVQYPTSAPLCRASQLRVTQAGGGGAGGTYYARVAFTNVGTTTCLLRGAPTIVAVGPDGVRRRLSSFARDSGVDVLVPADVAPGKHVLLDLRSPDQCYPAAHWRRPVFTFRGVGSISADRRFAVLVFCGISWSNVGLPRREIEPHVPPGAVGRLEPRVDAPAAVRAGAALVYTVTLRNPTRTAVSLSPCPGYTQGLYGSGPVVRGSYELDCATLRSIPPRGRVRFEMRLRVPRRARPGFAKLSWNLDTPTGPFSGSGIRIDRAATPSPPGPRLP